MYQPSSLAHYSFQLKNNIIDKPFINIVEGMAGWLPIPPRVYIKALENREKEREAQLKSQTKEEITEEDKEEEYKIEDLIPRKRIC